MKKIEREHLSKVAALGCCVCRKLGYGESPACCHHVRERTGMGKKASNYEVIPLCKNHHQGAGWGISYHDGAEEWERRYGTQQEFLEETLREVGYE